MEKLMILMVVAAMLVLTQVKVQGDQDNAPKDVRKRLQDSIFQRVRRCKGSAQPCNNSSECCSQYTCKLAMQQSNLSRCG
nr:TPA_inf: conotoxin precursor O2 [Conus ebraeus]